MIATCFSILIVLYVFLMLCSVYLILHKNHVAVVKFLHPDAIFSKEINRIFKNEEILEYAKKRMLKSILCYWSQLAIPSIFFIVFLFLPLIINGGIEQSHAAEYKFWAILDSVVIFSVVVLTLNAGGAFAVRWYSNYSKTWINGESKINNIPSTKKRNFAIVCANMHIPFASISKFDQYITDFKEQKNSSYMRLCALGSIFILLDWMKVGISKNKLGTDLSGWRKLLLYIDQKTYSVDEFNTILKDYLF